MNILNIPNNRLKSIYKNFISFFSIFSTQTIIQILFPPAMIFAWGVEKFGIWILITTIPSVLTILNINFSSAARSEMSINFEKRNLIYINKIFQNTFCLVLFSSIFFFLIWITAFSFDQINLKTLENIDYDELKIIFLFIALSSHCLILDQIFYCGITYTGDTSRYNYSILFFDTLIKILIPFLGLYTNNLLYASLILFILSFFKTFFLYIIFKNQSKNNLNLKINLFDIKLSIKIFRLSLSYHLDNISHIIRNNGFIILIGIFFSPVVIGLISTVRTLFYFLPIRFLDILNSTLFFEFSKMHGKNDIFSLKKIFKSHIYINIFLLTIFFTLSLLFGKLVYEFWTNNEYNLPLYLLILIIIDTVLFNFFNSIETFIKSINKFFYSSLVKTFLSILTILICYVLFTKGYSYLSYFILNIIASISVLIFVSINTLKIFKKYHK
jgi:O-antigen/teichoic acid export membrane protein